MKCITKYTINCMKEKQREHFNSLYTGTNKAIMELCHDGPYQDGKCTLVEIIEPIKTPSREKEEEKQAAIVVRAAGKSRDGRRTRKRELFYIYKFSVKSGAILLFLA